MIDAGTPVKSIYIFIRLNLRIIDLDFIGKWVLIVVKRWIKNGKNTVVMKFVCIV